MSDLNNDSKTELKLIMDSELVYTVYIKRGNEKTYQIKKDRYFRDTTQYMTEKDFERKYSMVNEDEALKKRFMKYIEENEPEYFV